MFENLFDWVLSFTTLSYAPWVLFLVAFTEASFFLVPPDLLLIPMSLSKPQWSFFYALIATLGSVLGGVFGVYLGKLGGRPLVNRFFSVEKIIAAEKLYQKYDFWAIAVAGFTPIPYKVFTVLAGVLKIRYSTVILASILSRGSRFFIVATLLYFYGEEVKIFIEKYFGVLSLALVGILILGFWVMKYLRKKEVYD